MTNRNSAGKRVLIAGGAGFIGTHAANELLEHGYRVRVLDGHVPQVHGAGGNRHCFADISLARRARPRAAPNSPRQG